MVTFPQTLYRILISLTSLLSILLAFWVYFANPKARVNRLFFLLSFFLLFWIGGGYFFYTSSNYIHALLLGRLLLGVGFLSLVLLYLFSIYFPKPNQEENYLLHEKVVSFLGVIVFLTTIFTNLVVQSIKITQGGTNPIYHPIGKFIYYGLLLFVALLILKNFLKKYFLAPVYEKLKLQYFLIGLFIFIGANLIFNIIFPILYGDIRYWQFGNYSAIFLLGFTALAIVKRRLFGIKVVLTELLVGVIAILLLINALVSTTIFDYVWKGITFLLFLVFGYLLIRYTQREAKQKEILEEKVRERTKELEKAKDIAEQRAREIEKRKADLEHFYKLTVGRELKMIELKKKIRELEEKERKPEGEKEEKQIKGF